MKKEIFTGSGVAIITPMNQDGSINYAELEKLIEFQIQNGTDAIITCGTTGESATMSHEEHCEVIRFTIEKVNVYLSLQVPAAMTLLMPLSCLKKQKNWVQTLCW